ncbi:MAG: L-glutamate gamma-semialdehyde dehydrogenase [Bdellovibrionia bacterium]
MFQLERPANEVIRSYEPDSLYRTQLKAELDRQAALKADIPNVIGGRPSRDGERRVLTMPHNRHQSLGYFHMAGPAQMHDAVAAALKAKPAWEAMAWKDRAAIFLKAADLIAGPYRNLLNAATMLGQSKNAFQAEIDSACELIDFLRFNSYFYQEIQKVQPASAPGISNMLEYRPLEGFVLAITPFNFTAIAANLPAAPALLGNTVVWKPSDTQMLSAHYAMEIFREAGLPEGVINLVAADGPLLGRTLLPHRDLAGVHFTGSTHTFQSIWRNVGEHITNYRTYPRLVGETGGKDFVFAHPSADIDALSTALVRGAFEYQGQKCSAASRAYIPKSIWHTVGETVMAQLSSVTVGDVRDFTNFVNAVIDERAFDRINGYLQHAKDSPDAKIIYGGKATKEVGYFIEPTVIQALKPNYKSMVEEIFGPVLTVYVYDDSKLDETLEICDTSTPYSLTGAIFAQDRYAIQHMSEKLKHAAGNFYINDKPTGAVVGQQPFGGSRASGTNDKAGSPFNLNRWLSPRTVKETYVPAKDYQYPFMRGR